MILGGCSDASNVSGEDPPNEVYIEKGGNEKARRTLPCEPPYKGKKSSSERIHVSNEKEQIQERGTNGLNFGLCDALREIV